MLRRLQEQNHLSFTRIEDSTGLPQNMVLLRNWTPTVTAAAGGSGDGDITKIPEEWELPRPEKLPMPEELLMPEKSHKLPGPEGLPRIQTPMLYHPEIPGLTSGPLRNLMPLLIKWAKDYKR